MLQRNEFARYARDVNSGRQVLCLTGTAALLRVGALKRVAASAPLFRQRRCESPTLHHLGGEGALLGAYHL
jgi:hypothetical protein